MPSSLLRRMIATTILPPSSVIWPACDVRQTTDERFGQRTSTGCSGRIAWLYLWRCRTIIPGYPLVREARAAVAADELGEIRLLHVTYMQGTLGTRVEDQPQSIPSRLAWRLDPARGGESHVMGDIGTHAHQLLHSLRATGVAKVLADIGAVYLAESAHDTGAVIMTLTDGARGMLFASKAATGAENALKIEVYGEAGGLSWSHNDPNTLRSCAMAARQSCAHAGLRPCILSDAGQRGCRLASRRFSRGLCQSLYGLCRAGGGAAPRCCA